MEMTRRTRTCEALIERLLSEVRISADQRSASVGGTSLTADNAGDLARRLALVLYDEYHLRRVTRRVSAPPRRDPKAEENIIRGLPHLTVNRTLELLDTSIQDVLLRRGGARVWTPVHRLRGRADQSGPGVEVELPSYDAAVSPGYVMVEGTARSSSAARPWARFYAHVLDPARVRSVLRAAIIALEAENVPYRVKACSDPSEFPRTDSLVVYLSASASRAVPSLVAALADEAGLGNETSQFVLRLGPGMGLALEPADPRPEGRGLSFGIHRGAVLAHALVEGSIDGANTRSLLKARLGEAWIDADRLWRNVDSTDLPFVTPTGG